MPCVCTHDKIIHETWRDYGWHEGGCTKCSCECFYAKRTFEKDMKNGINIPNSVIGFYEKNYKSKLGDKK